MTAPDLVTVDAEGSSAPHRHSKIAGGEVD